jgi:hypothetical protein
MFHPRGRDNRNVTRAPPPPIRMRVRARSGVRTLLLAATLLTDVASSPRAQTPPMDEADSAGIAGNPGAVDVRPGTGALGRLLGLDPSTGFRLGGVLVSNGNYLLSGGNHPRPSQFQQPARHRSQRRPRQGRGYSGREGRRGAAPLRRAADQPAGRRSHRLQRAARRAAAAPDRSLTTSWWCGSARRFRSMISATWSARFRCRTFRCRSRW